MIERLSPNGDKDGKSKNNEDENKGVELGSWIPPVCFHLFYINDSFMYCGMLCVLCSFYLMCICGLVVGCWLFVDCF